MNTSIRTLFSCYLFALCFFGSQCALSEEVTYKPDKNYSVFYRVENFIKKETMVQEYAFEIYSKPEPHYVIHIKNNANKTLIATEAETYWNKITTVVGQEQYADLSLSENIREITEDTRFFGRIEIKSLQDHSIIDAWPVFGSVEKKGELFVSTLTAYLRNGTQLIITSVYGQNLHHIPAYRRTRLLASDGTVLSDVELRLM